MYRRRRAARWDGNASKTRGVALTNETTRAETTNVSGLATALGGYAVLFALKLITYFVTGIGVMYAESVLVN